jgi:hypothetical protein
MGYSRRKRKLGKKGRSKKRRSYSKKRYLRGGTNLGENSMKEADDAAVSNNIKQVKKGNYPKLQ